MSTSDWAGPAPSVPFEDEIPQPRPAAPTNGTPAREVDTAALSAAIDTSHALAAEAGAMDVQPSATKNEIPQVTQAGGIATKGLDGVTDAIVSQIEAAISELNNLRSAVIEANETTRAQVGRQVQLGTVVGTIVANIRAGFRVPTA